MIDHLSHCVVVRERMFTQDRYQTLLVHTMGTFPNFLHRRTYKLRERGSTLGSLFKGL